MLHVFNTIQKFSDFIGVPMFSSSNVGRISFERCSDDYKIQSDVFSVKGSNRCSRDKCVTVLFCNDGNVPESEAIRQASVVANIFKHYRILLFFNPIRAEDFRSTDGKIALKKGWLMRDLTRVLKRETSKSMNPYMALSGQFIRDPLCIITHGSGAQLVRDTLPLVSLLDEPGSYDHYENICDKVTVHALGGSVSIEDEFLPGRISNYTNQESSESRSMTEWSDFDCFTSEIQKISQDIHSQADGL
jgi:hypothetical protein